MKSLIVAILLGCVALSAHPGNALVADARGNVYFAYWGGTWRLEATGKTARLHSNDLHFLGVDRAGRFANTTLPDVLRITPKGENPALFAFPEYPATFHTDGYLYIAPWSVGRIRLQQIAPDGSARAFVDLPITPRLARTPGRHEGGVLAIASGPNGLLYVTDGASIWTVNSRGVIAPVAEGITVPDCPTDLPLELPRPHIRGLAVDATGDVYAAATGCRAVLKLTSAGVITSVLRAESPWSPTAVEIASGDLYVMEFDNPLAERPAEGRPRIRRVSRDGRVTVPVLVEQYAASGRRAR